MAEDPNPQKFMALLLSFTGFMGAPFNYNRESHLLEIDYDIVGTNNVCRQHIVMEYHPFLIDNVKPNKIIFVIADYKTLKNCNSNF